MNKKIIRTMKAPIEEEKWDYKYDVKTVSAKLTQREYAKFKDYCDKKGNGNLKPSRVIKDLIDKEIKDPLAINLAGKSQFVYNPAKDNFGWRAILDKGIISYIEDDLSPEFLEQLRDALDIAIDERGTFLQKRNGNSVAMPGKLVRGGM